MGSAEGGIRLMRQHVKRKMRVQRRRSYASQREWSESLAQPIFWMLWWRKLHSKHNFQNICYSLLSGGVRTNRILWLRINQRISKCSIFNTQFSTFRRGSWHTKRNDWIEKLTAKTQRRREVSAFDRCTDLRRWKTRIFNPSHPFTSAIYWDAVLHQGLLSGIAILNFQLRSPDEHWTLSIDCWTFFFALPL